jgi:hypothetical protein
LQARATIKARMLTENRAGDDDEDENDEAVGWESEAPAPKKVKKTAVSADHEFTIARTDAAT